MEVTQILESKDIGLKISVDGKGCWIDNVFVQRLWRGVKYEGVYLRAYESVNEARSRIGDYLKFYNSKRKHHGLGKTPVQVYFGEIVLPEAA